MRKYILNVLLGFDTFVNAVFAGDPKMTISTRVYLYKDTNCIARLVYKFLDWLQPGHCEAAVLYDSKSADNNNSVLK